MLIDLTKAVRDHGLNITGIVHAGAHHGQEYEAYKENGVENIIFVEPCSAAFDVLLQKFSDKKDVLLHNYALGNTQNIMYMNVEKANMGQSNSLLKPEKHLEQYPNIIFEDGENVFVTTMDKLPYTREKYNMLMMDVQGYELEVLKGATKSLRFFDVIYTEVNRDEVYKNCARIEQIDELLKDFERIETNWGGGTWGDAIYKRKQPASALNSETSEHTNRVEVPEQFRPHICKDYPEDNKIIFEEWYFENFEGGQSKQDQRIYLPVFWTSYYVNHRYGTDKLAIGELQDFLDTLDKNKKYYTIVQYDDGILNDISELDIKVFAMSGPRVDYPLPLICQPHKTPRYNKGKLYLASFLGEITHPIRKKMLEALKGQEGIYIGSGKSIDEFCQIMEASTFALCPRGYGNTSFRIAEAVQYGAIPVYISDDFICPHEGFVDAPIFLEYGIIIKPHQINKLSDILRSISPEKIKSAQALLPEIYRKYYTYEGNKKVIEQNIIC